MIECKYLSMHRIDDGVSYLYVCDITNKHCKLFVGEDCKDKKNSKIK